MLSRNVYDVNDVWVGSKNSSDLPEVGIKVVYAYILHYLHKLT